MAVIYIVEDDENIQEIETVALKSTGHEVLAFGNAKGFYEKIQETLPNLVILDVMLPDENGNEIIKKLRSHAKTDRKSVV